MNVISHAHWETGKKRTAGAVSFLSSTALDVFKELTAGFIISERPLALRPPSSTFLSEIITSSQQVLATGRLSSLILAVSSSLKRFSLRSVIKLWDLRMHASYTPSSSRAALPTPVEESSDQSLEGKNRPHGIAHMCLNGPGDVLYALGLDNRLVLPPLIPAQEHPLII